MKQYQTWYNQRAVTAKRRFLWMRALSVLGGALVSVLANVNLDLTIAGYRVITIILTVVSLIVVIFVSLESVLHYREQWKNYRSTEQSIGQENFRYQNRIAAYSGLDDAAAFKLFVERVEDMIAAENAATLSVMTRAFETGIGKKSAHGRTN